MSNIVAIVGRPNVGKSTLFNRLIKERKAIMDDESGITRDRHYGHAEWCGYFYSVIDTGGYVTNSDDIFEDAIRSQVQLAIDEATVIMFVVDVDTGITELDKEFAHVLRKSKKPVFIVANKADNALRMHLTGDFYSMGFTEIHAISAATGSGTGELLDDVVKHFKDKGIENPDEGIPKISIVGRPNVGKSSMVNVLLGNERSIVTDIAGTTRDSINAYYKMFGKTFILVDTAGVRKKSKVKEDVEFYSVMRSVRAIEDCDVCILMLDATQGLESQDLNILRLAQRNHKGVVILVNKWDLIEKDTNTAITYEKELKEKLAPNDYIPIIFVSVHNKQRIFKAIEKAIQVYENKSMRISTAKLNDLMLRDIKAYPPPIMKGKTVSIKYVTQLPGVFPSFVYFCNLPQYISPSYERYLENKMRAHFGFEGVPIKIYFRKK